MRKAKTVGDQVNESIEGSGKKPSPRLFSDVVGAYAHSAPTFDVSLPGGEMLRFKHVTGGVQHLKNLQQFAKEFAGAVEDGKAKQEFEPYMKAGVSTLVWCHIMAGLSAPTDEVEAGSVLDFLAFQKVNPVAFEYVREQVATSLSGLADWLEKKAINERQKKSPTTRPGETD